MIDLSVLDRGGSPSPDEATSSRPSTITTEARLNSFRSKFPRVSVPAARNTASSFAASFRARCVFPAPGSPRITMGMGRFRTSDSAVRSWRRNFGYESKSARSRMEGRSFAKKKAGPFGPASLGILARYSLRGHLGTFSQSLRNLARPMSVSGCFTSCSMTA